MLKLIATPTKIFTIFILALSVWLKYTSSIPETYHLWLTGMFSLGLLASCRNFVSFTTFPSRNFFLGKGMWVTLIFISISLASIALASIIFEGNAFQGRKLIRSTDSLQLTTALLWAVPITILIVSREQSEWHRLALRINTALDEIYDTYTFLFDREYFEKPKKISLPEESALSIIAAGVASIVLFAVLITTALTRYRFGSHSFDATASLLLLCCSLTFCFAHVYMLKPKRHIEYVCGAFIFSLIYILLTL